jgi:hypothetical protein
MLNRAGINNRQTLGCGASLSSAGMAAPGWYLCSAVFGPMS